MSSPESFTCRLDDGVQCAGIDANSTLAHIADVREYCLSAKQDMFRRISDAAEVLPGEGTAENIVNGLCGNNAFVDVFPKVGVLVSFALEPVRPFKKAQEAVSGGNNE